MREDYLGYVRGKPFKEITTLPFARLIQATKYNDMFRRLSGPAAYQCGRGHPGDLALV